MTDHTPKQPKQIQKMSITYPTETINEDQESQDDGLSYTTNNRDPGQLESLRITERSLSRDSRHQPTTVQKKDLKTRKRQLSVRIQI